MKAYKDEDIEVIEIVLNRHKYPTSFKRKVDELMNQGAFETREEAERWVEKTPITLELIYEEDYGLFAVESDAVDVGVYSPYTKQEILTEE
jgi:hypothetical protein